VTALASQAPTPFGAILRRAVESTPGAIGGAFAASDGELVDSYATWDTEMWAVLTAHYGIVLSHLRAAFGTWHYGGPEYFIVQHERLDVVVQVVDAGYYVLMAVDGPAPLARALAATHEAAAALAQEMG
jgi:hypothetical protein